MIDSSETLLVIRIKTYIKKRGCPKRVASFLLGKIELLNIFEIINSK
jgi:hypothetical protein